MRRLGFILSLVILVALFVSIATLTAGAQTTDSTSRPSVSQGTVTGANPPRPSGVRPRATWWRRRPCPTTRRSWTARTSRYAGVEGGVWAHGGEYVTAGASTSEARFKLKTPQGDYALYAWWPVRSTAAVPRDRRGDCQGHAVGRGEPGPRQAGMWKLGTYEMKAGDRYVVRVSPGGGSGEVIADAVALVRGAASPPPKDSAPAEGSVGSGTNVYGASNTNVERRDIVRYGRTHIGTPITTSTRCLLGLREGRLLLLYQACLRALR